LTSWKDKVRKKTAVVVFIACVIGVIAFAWYESLPHPNGQTGLTNYWVIYTLTPSGNHTQIKTTYYNGNAYTDQIYWLNFENKTQLYNYFKCTPSMRGCTLDGCSFSVLVDNATEYEVRTGDPCGP
jgi:hypothetical protein